ncbi:5-oxoprolinase subunit PxpB [Paenibacillus tianjinensis]|uniref:5-oxoprolinase subunit PxpB n=1 Tax=Paenibacillus tianjinensis TaxID=2810347 RepID=A0ABX7LJB9_9BACL|nr:5-oxoprolinase subunit PxpB [Paenibacillus tianjinensis]QSF46978.1 5-oxoprolinase subunit PxpB [Paenibacillus tianjinensis]
MGETKDGSELVPNPRVNHGAARIVPLGDSAAVVILGDSISPQIHHRVRALCSYLEHHPFTGMVELVPSFTSIAVYYDGLAVLKAYPEYIRTGAEYYLFPVVAELLEKMLSLIDDEPPPQPRTVSIPVYYGGEAGPDLEFVAEHNGLLPQEVIDIHSSSEYLVYMLGFAPGFPYLGGLPSAISTPRRLSPRVAIPAGSVGIAGDQTGVYPLETPGGWQLIGRTPLSLFKPEAELPTLLEAGDTVRFYPISRREFMEWGEDTP